MFFSGIYQLIGFSLDDRTSPRVSRTLLSGRADFNSGVVWKVSILPLISSPCRLLVTVPSEPATSGITVIFFYFFCIRFLLFSLNNNFVFLLLNRRSAPSTGIC